MKHKTEALWRICFNDTEEFIRLYFTHRYKDDITMTMKEADQIIASLQMIPYPMTFCDQIIPTSYISGACTHPEYRNRGIMNELLRNSLRAMWKKGDLLTTLIPAERWLFDYYNKFGYATVFFYSTSFLVPDRIKQKTENKIEQVCPDDSEAYQYFNEKMLSRPYCIQHTREDFTIILKDIQLSGGKTFIIKDNEEEIKGILFCTIEEDKIIIKEIITEGEIYERLLLAEIIKTYGNKPIEVIQFPEKNIKKLGMARLINVPGIVDIYIKNYPELSFCFKLYDPVIESNSGYYHLQNGIFTKTDFPLKESYVEVTIPQLTELILLGKDQTANQAIHSFPSQLPYMSLMLN